MIMFILYIQPTKSRFIRTDLNGVQGTRVTKNFSKISVMFKELLSTSVLSLVVQQLNLLTQFYHMPFQEYITIFIICMMMSHQLPRKEKVMLSLLIRVSKLRKENPSWRNLKLKTGNLPLRKEEVKPPTSPFFPL